MPRASASDVYAELLWSKYYGHPLWDPELAPGGEVRLGDVGFIREGAFHRLFNAYPHELWASAFGHTDQESEVNPFGVPEGFEPFSSRGRDNFGYRPRSPGLSHSRTSKDVTVTNLCRPSFGEMLPMIDTGVLSLEYNGNQHGAALLIEAGDSKFVKFTRRLSDYMKKNHDSWVLFANDTMDIDMASEDIVLVIKWVKTARWAMVVMDEGAPPLIFTGAFGCPEAFRSSESAITHSNLKYKSGPHLAVDPPQSLDDPMWKHNQCIFVGYLKVRRRGLLKQVIKAAAKPRDPSNPRDNDNNVLESKQPFDPAGYVLDYILKHSEAETAIASNLDIHMLCKDEEIPDNIPEFLEQVQPVIELTEDGLGILSLHKYMLHDLEISATIPPEGVPMSAKNIKMAIFS
ncbi:hypothetical protein BKA93DRAFT_822112 [Sparassis latifolia]